PLHPPPRSTLFPYTTLFRSLDGALDLLQQGLAVERLLDELDGPRLHRPDRHRHVGVGGDEDHRHRLAAGGQVLEQVEPAGARHPDRKSTRLNSSHVAISYAV